MLSYISDCSDVSKAFDEYLSQLADALRGMGLDTVRTEHNDVLVGGRKVSGNACFADASVNKSATDYHQTSLNMEGAYSDQFWMIQGNVGYTMDRSKSDYLDKASGGKRFNAGVELSYQSSIGLGASTRCSYNRPFGYEMESANRPECLWNISAEWSFLKSRQATLSLTWRDILKQYNGFSASVSGTNWNESRTFGDTSMFIISFNYRFNDFR